MLSETPRSPDEHRDLPPGVRIVERSWLAWLASRKLRSKRVAMVIGNSIHLTGATAGEFLGNAAWVAHELAHVQQYRRHGTLRFLALYLLESLKRGYHANRFEVEARQAERGHNGTRVAARRTRDGRA